MSRFNLPLVNGREAGEFEPPRGYENLHGVEEHFFFPPSSLSLPPAPRVIPRALAASVFN